MKRLCLLALLALPACSGPSPEADSLPVRGAALIDQNEVVQLYASQVSAPKNGANGRFLGVKAIDVNLKGAFAWGRRDAPVTVVEFGDFECPFCADSHLATSLPVRQAIEEGRLRWVFMDFPLPIHRHAIAAAESARCAAHQKGAKGFWQMHHFLYVHQQYWHDAADIRRSLSLVADEAGVGGEAFQSCMEKGTERAEVLRFGLLATQLGLSATPSYFFNGLLVVGKLRVAQVDTIVATLRQKSAEEVLRGESIPILP